MAPALFSRGHDPQDLPPALKKGPMQPIMPFIDMYAKYVAILTKALQVFEKASVKRGMYSWTTEICIVQEVVEAQTG
jgi:hypothetical protein